MPFSWGITPLIAACKQKQRRHLRKQKMLRGGVEGVENTIKENKYTLKI